MSEKKQEKQHPDGLLPSPGGASGGDVAKNDGRARKVLGKKAKLGDDIAEKYGYMPGMLLADTLMRGLPEWIEAGGHPGDFLVQYRAHEIADELDVTPGAAMAHLQSIAKELHPYVHNKLPQAQDAQGNNIYFGFMTRSGEVAGPGVLHDMRPADVIEAEKAPKSDEISQKEEDKPNE